MSKFPGGIFSKARGKVGGLVFSAARAREGKVMTVRELVIPANPRTPQQQANRGLFQFIQAAVRGIGREIYHNDFNRGVSDLPGYQSLLSLLRRQYNLYGVWPGEFAAQADFLAPDTLLGELHFPATVEFVNGSSTSFTVNWSTENGINGNMYDEVMVIYASGTVGSNRDLWVFGEGPEAQRHEGTTTVVTPPQLDTPRRLIGIYFKNPNNDVPNQLSVARWGTQ